MGYSITLPRQVTLRYHSRAAPVALTPFELALLYLVPSRSRKAIIGLFDGRYSYWSIKDWRRGKAKPPREALATLLALVAREEERAREIGDLLQTNGVAPGQGSHRNIAKWNARQARERDQANREKALQRDR